MRSNYTWMLLALLAKNVVAAVSSEKITEERSTNESNSSTFLRRPSAWTSTSSSSGSLTKFHNISNKTACEIVESHELPEECSCRQPDRFGVVVECLKKFNSTYFNDTIGMKINIDPCNSDGSRISIDITERDHNIDYAIVGIRAGEAKNYPIPGCAIIVPYVGHLGLDAAVLVYGNPDQLTLKVGLNACAVINDHDLCASSIPGLNQILPWYVLSGTYSFGDYCNSTNTTTGAIGVSSVPTSTYYEQNIHGTTTNEDKKKDASSSSGGGWLPFWNNNKNEEASTILDLSNAAYE